MRLLYLTTIYPKTSHSFIRREILELERRGHTVDRAAIREPEEKLVHPDDIREYAKTLYCVSRGMRHLLTSFLSEMTKQPLVMAAALATTLELSRDSDRGSMRHLAYLAEASLLRAHCRDRKIEHVHVHFGTNPTAVALLLRRLGGPPYSFTIHGPDEWDAPVGFRLREKIEQAAFVVAISNFGAAQARRWVGAEYWHKIRVIRSGAPSGAFDHAAPIASDSKTFLFVGRLCRQKAPLFLVDAMEHLVIRDPDVKLTFIGDGDQRPAVEARIREKDLQDAIELVGWLPEMQVFRFMRASRCVVLPSFAEGLPVVLIEALALQRPVISTYIAAIPELVSDGSSGFLVAAGDLDSLVDAMWHTLQTPSHELDSMGRLGAATVRKRHDLATGVDRLERAFESARNAHRVLD